MKQVSALFFCLMLTMSFSGCQMETDNTGKVLQGRFDLNATDHGDEVESGGGLLNLTFSRGADRIIVDANGTIEPVNGSENSTNLSWSIIEIKIVHNNIAYSCSDPGITSNLCEVSQHGGVLEQYWEVNETATISAGADWFNTTGCIGECVVGVNVKDDVAIFMSDVAELD